MAVYGYIRVSHEESKRSGLSVEAQRLAIEGYCKLRGLEEPRLFIDEAVSAWKVPFCERPQGFNMVSVMKPGDTIIFYRLDRGFRSLLDFVRTVPAWAKAGYNIVLLDQNFDFSTANGTLFLNVMAAYAQWKSDMISDRTKAGLERAKMGIPGVRKRKKAQGKYVANGYRQAKRAEVQELPRCEQGAVYSYGRVSHADSMQGMSLEAQKHAIDGYIEFKLGDNARGAHFEDHAVSAYSVPMRDRPEGGALNAILKRGDHVVFARLDRVWRSTFDMADTWRDWKRRGVTIHFADTHLDTSTASGEAMLEMLAVFAKWEAADISERTKAALDRVRAQGRPVNNKIRMGFRTLMSGGKRYVMPDAKKMRDMWLIHHMRTRHNMGFYEISDQMEIIDAHREQRRPLPRHGISARMVKKFYGHKGAAKCELRKGKGDIILRKWDFDRCQIASRQWPEVQELVQEMVA